MENSHSNYIVLDNEGIFQAERLIFRDSEDYYGGQNLDMFNIYGARAIYSFEHQLDCLNNLIMSLLFFEQIFTVGVDFHNNEYEFLSEQHVSNLIYRHHDLELERLINRIALENINKLEYDNYSTSLRALYYFYYSNYLNINYLPSPLRSKFLVENKINHFNNFIFDNIDEKISKDFIKINQLLGSNFQYAKIPSLLNYVIKQSSRKEDIFKVTLQIRNSDGATKLRKWLRDIDGCLQAGDVIQLSRELNMVAEVVEEFSKEIDNRKSNEDYEIGFGLSFPPSVNFPIKIKKNAFFKKKHQIVFLTDMISKSYHSHMTEDKLCEYFKH